MAGDQSRPVVSTAKGGFELRQVQSGSRQLGVVTAETFGRDHQSPSRVGRTRHTEQRFPKALVEGLEAGLRNNLPVEPEVAALGASLGQPQTFVAAEAAFGCADPDECATGPLVHGVAPRHPRVRRPGRPNEPGSPTPARRSEIPQRKTMMVLFLFKRGTCTAIPHRTHEHAPSTHGLGRVHVSNGRSGGFPTPGSGEWGTNSPPSQGLYSPSVTAITRSAGRSWRVCFSPPGQLTSSESTRVLRPNPKLTR